jgi:quinol monooxygenase YgiN
MHVQVINFQLRDMSPAQFAAQCDELAPAFAAIPGLLSKVWLANATTNTYGGVYTWRDRQAMEAFTRGQLFQAVAANPKFDGITSVDFAVVEGPTRVTRGLLGTAV